MDGAKENSAIDDAIREYMAAKGVNSVVTGWVAIVSTSGHDGETETSGIHLVYPNGTQPWHTALGLIEGGRLLLHQEFTDTQ
jgi:hypothetical protein